MALPKFYLEIRNLKREPEESAQAYESRKDETSFKINMLYSFHGSRLAYYTGVWIKRKHYKDFKGSGDKRITLNIDRSDVSKLISDNTPYSVPIKAKLKQMALDAQNIANAAKVNKIPLTVEHMRHELDKIHKPKEEAPEIKEKTYDLVSFFEKVLEDSKSGKRLISKGPNTGSRYTHNAIKNYGVTLSAIKRYVKEFNIKKIELDDVNKDFYEKFRSFIYDNEQKEKSTFAGYVKDIKTVMYESGNTKFRSIDFTTPSYEADTIYLNPEQIDRLASVDLSDHNKYYHYEHENIKDVIGYGVLEKIRDLATIGFWTGLRHSDLNNLERKNINGDFLNVKQIKTGGRITIPIVPKLQAVLEKYPNELPKYSTQKFNSYLKALAKLAGLREMIEIKSTTGNMESRKSFPLYSLISSHIMRRSFATNMFNAGVPPMLIMSATGHSTESSFLTYIRSTNDEKAKIFMETLKKLGL